MSESGDFAHGDVALPNRLPELVETSSGLPVDAAARAQALDISVSCVVTAPAGAGKTELLTQRMLGLLAVVDEPEEILAITFTRKAAAEMRERLLGALALGMQAQAPAASHRLATWQLARRALERDSARNWQLLHNPARLRLQTIDSFCYSVASEQPVLSLLGGALQPVDDPQPLYTQAVSELLATLGERGGDDRALRRLLDYYRGDVHRLSTMLAAMLQGRDQWLASMVDLTGAAQAGGDSAAELADCLEKWIAELLAHARQKLQRYAGDLVAIADFAGTMLRDNPALAQSSPVAILAGLQALPEAAAAALPEWRGLLALLFTARSEPRRTVDKRLGFPVDKSWPAELRTRSAAHKKRLQQICAEIATDEATLAALQTVPTLPDCGYGQAQDELLAAMAHCLVQLYAHLQLVFAEQRRCDHSEVTAAALRVLGANPPQAGSRQQQVTEPIGAAYAWHRRLRHILVDEYQDTSVSQHRLLCALTSDWAQLNATQSERARTLFIVGDAMQSIYAFRAARVQLFLRARRGALGDLPLQRIDLVQNFRSTAALVDWFNRYLGAAFPQREDSARGAVTFARAVAFAPPGVERAQALPAIPGSAAAAGAPVGFYACIGEDADTLEAHKVLELVQCELTARPDASIAILVRVRGHLQTILPALRAAGIDVENSGIDALCEREEVADCLALTRALLSVHDHIAWWALLRAPWCGLPLAELQVLRNHMDSCACCAWLPQLLVSASECGSLCRQLQGLLADDAVARLHRLALIVGEAWRMRERYGLRDNVERCWDALGGAALASLSAEPDAPEVVAQYFAELELLDAECRHRGESLHGELLQQRMQLLRAEQASPAKGGVYAMTMHKAKGLEFDTVILPGLAGTPRGEDVAMLEFGERVFADGSSGVLLYPKTLGDDENLASGESFSASSGRSQRLAGTDTDNDNDKDKNKYKKACSIYDFLRSEKKLQGDYESTRLLYVAATRARSRLLLTATMRCAEGHVGAVDAESLRPPPRRSLLAKLWPALREQAQLLVSPASTSKTGAAVVPQYRPLKRFSAAALSAQQQRLAHARAAIAESANTVPAAGITARQAGTGFAAAEFSVADINEAEANTVRTMQQPRWMQAVGSCAHELLHLAVQQGSGRWRERDPGSPDGHWRERLRQLGVTPDLMTVALQRLQRAALGFTQAGEGEQLLQRAAQGAACEWELWYRDVDGVRRRARMDLTFVDVQGRRWLVDYKIAEPAAGETVDDFLQQQDGHYRDQLLLYRALLAKFDDRPPEQIVAALYYPLLDRLLPISLA